MNLQQLYSQPAKWLAVIGAGAVALLAIGGLIIGLVLRQVYGPGFDGFGLCLQVGRIRLPFWPLAFVFLLICFGIAAFKHGLLSAAVGFERSLQDNRTTAVGGYVTLGSPAVLVGAKSLVCVGSLLFLFIVLSAQAAANP